MLDLLGTIKINQEEIHNGEIKMVAKRRPFSGASNLMDLSTGVSMDLSFSYIDKTVILFRKDAPSYSIASLPNVNENCIVGVFRDPTNPIKYKLMVVWTTKNPGKELVVPLSELGFTWPLRTTSLDAFYTRSENDVKTYIFECDGLYLSYRVLDERSTLMVPGAWYSKSAKADMLDTFDKLINTAPPQNQPTMITGIVSDGDDRLIVYLSSKLDNFIGTEKVSNWLSINRQDNDKYTYTITRDSEEITKSFIPEYVGDKMRLIVTY